MIIPITNEFKKENLIPFNDGVLQYCNKQNLTRPIYNIIIIGEKDFNYVNLANYSNGDLVIETTSLSGSARSTEKFLNGQMNNIRGTIFNYQINNLYYALIGYINSYENRFYLNKPEFKEIEKRNLIFNYFNNSNRVGKTLSCFMTDKKYIMCLYSKITTYNSNNKFNYGYIKVIQNSKDNKNYTELKGIYLEDMHIEDSIFLKAIHYKGEIGIFIYYYFY